MPPKSKPKDDDERGNVMSFCQFSIKQTLRKPRVQIERELVRTALAQQTTEYTLAVALLVLTPSEMQNKVIRLFTETAGKR